MFYIVIWSPIN